jgi:ribosomal peptide maturation radical SAM protein 1
VTVTPDVALVSMPFGPVFSPSLGLTLLRGSLAKRQLTARIHYFTIRFAETIGRALYSNIAEKGCPALEDLAGEYLFSHALFDRTADDVTRYVTDRLDEYYSDALIARFLRAREGVDAFLDECLDALVRERPPIVGFTSVFQQHTASLALARRIKTALPSTFVVFGGANCEGIMGAETIRSFPFVDAAVSGEGDLIFPQLVQHVLDGRSIEGLPGVRTRPAIEREFAAGDFSNGPMVRNLDDLPVPDYGDYFQQFKASRYDRDWYPIVFVETSRGCWWGERMHCTFCGLNGATMAYRSKSAARAVDEITVLARRHPDGDIYAVDNILDLSYFKDVIRELAARRLKPMLFYETKSNLRKEQVRLLRDAGIRKIQPGIESFSDTVLKLMRKGVTGLQNIQLLKWCKELGVKASWNFLWGFPGEPPDEYDRQARLVPLVTHLQPPNADAPIRLDRFSPNFFDAARIGFTNVRPIPAYEYVYSLPPEAIANLACYFSYEYKEPRDVDGYTLRLERELQKWRRAATHSELLSLDADEHLVIVDLRPVSRSPFAVLTALARFLYRECDAVRDVSELGRAARERGWSVAAGEIEQTLGPLVDRGLLLRDGSRYLALAIPVGDYVPPPATNRQFSRLVRSVGVVDGERWIVAPETARSNQSRKRTRARGPRVAHLAACRVAIDASGRLIFEARRENVTRRLDGETEKAREEESEISWRH